MDAAVSDVSSDEEVEETEDDVAGMCASIVSRITRSTSAEDASAAWLAALQAVLPLSFFSLATPPSARVQRAATKAAHLATEGVLSAAAALFASPLGAGSDDAVLRNLVASFVVQLYSALDPVHACDFASKRRLVGVPLAAAVLLDAGCSACLSTHAAESLLGAAQRLARVTSAALVAAQRSEAAASGDGHESAAFHYVDRLLRLMRQLFSLERGVLAPPLARGAAVSAVSAVVLGNALLLDADADDGAPSPASARAVHLRLQALSALWSAMDSEPGEADALAADPRLLASLREHIAAPQPPPPVDGGTDARTFARDELRCAFTEALLSTLPFLRLTLASPRRSVAVGGLWGSASRVSPSAARAFAAAGLGDALSALVESSSHSVAHHCGADKDAHRGGVGGGGEPPASPTVAFCAAGALAGWLSVAPTDARLASLWRAPRFTHAVARLLGDACALLRRADASPQLPRAADGAGEPRDASVEALFETACFDWKDRDLNETVDATCRNLALARAARRDHPATAEPFRLAAATALWPLVAMLHSKCAVLPATRAAAIAAHPALVPAAAALAFAPACARCDDDDDGGDGDDDGAVDAAAAVVRAALAHACGRSPAAAAAAVGCLSSASRAAARSVRHDVAILCSPTGVLLPSSSRLLAARSPFFAALFASRRRGFQDPLGCAPRGAGSDGHRSCDGDISGGGGDAAPAAPPLPVVELKEAPPEAVASFLEWAETGGVAVAGVSDALSSLALARRLLARPFAALLRGAATSSAAASLAAATPGSDTHPLRLLLGFAFATDGWEAQPLRDWATRAAVNAGLVGSMLQQADEREGDDATAPPQLPPDAAAALRAALCAQEAAGGADDGGAPSAASSRKRRRKAADDATTT